MIDSGEDRDVETFSPHRSCLMEAGIKQASYEPGFLRLLAGATTGSGNTLELEPSPGHVEDELTKGEMLHRQIYRPCTQEEKLGLKILRNPYAYVGSMPEILIS